LRLAALVAAGAAATGCRDKERAPLIAPGAEVIVIGAGFAGIGAALELKRLGYRPLVVEARGRIGGRAHTDLQLGPPVDLGASWLHNGPRLNPLQAVAAEAGIRSRPERHREAPVIALDSGLREAAGALVDRTQANDKLDAALRWPWLGGKSRQLLGLDLPRDSLADLWREAGGQLGAAECFIRILLETRLATDLDTESISALLEDAPEGYDESLLPAGERLLLDGMQRIVEYLARGLDVRLNTLVRRIDWQRDGVALQTSTGELRAQAAVVTCSVGVLKAHPELFAPALPAAHAAALGRLGMGLLSKIAVAFARTDWPQPWEAAAFCGAAIAPVAVNLGGDASGPAVVMGLAGGRGAHRLDHELPPEQAADFFRRQLERAFGIRLSEPVGVLTSRWKTDPLALGAYSTLPVGAQGNEAEILGQPVDGVLVLAGEALAPYDRGTVHGAFLSGGQAVRRLLATV
jgi:monoamine oxidase